MQVHDVFFGPLGPVVSGAFAARIVEIRADGTLRLQRKVLELDRGMVVVRSGDLGLREERLQQRIARGMGVRHTRSEHGCLL
ncbi:hypothetical protein [Piscinibacter sp.]|uniref:hypothetical protein n=1 Tax=Piscinibacter sp. TaxID=1903157 RepID=UPI0025CCEF40|nr:hypothetical protein [Piscinibacter sp.]